MRKTLCVVAALFAICLPLLGQNVPTCTVNNDNVQPNCTGSTWLTGLTSCQHKTITCQPFNGITFAPIGITLGYKNPSGTPNGTIVFFSNSGGKTTDSPGSTSVVYAQYTQITAWLCSSVVLGGGPMNNSSPEAQLFFQQFTSPSQIPFGLLINGVGNCGNDEDITNGAPPSNYVYANGVPMNGQEAVEYDMTLDPVNLCTSHHPQ